MKRSEMIEKMQDILEHDYALVLPSKEICMALLDMMEEVGMKAPKRRISNEVMFQLEATRAPREVVMKVEQVWEEENE